MASFRTTISQNATVSLLAITAACLATPAFAQDAPADGDARDIVVTGSRLLTTKQAEALPLRSIDMDDIAKQGSPPLLDIIRALPESAGAIGNSNSSQPGKGQGFEGSESVNLRGLGPDRNLVLLNGKRLPLTSGYFVNTRNIPASAIARIEILKDAASTTYGSDAMTGVVNFITKRGFTGLDMGGDYTLVDDTGGDWRVDATYGAKGDNWDLLVSGGYQKRAQLRVKDRPWSTPPYSVNPDAGWNFSSNPAQFVPVGLVGPGGTLAATGARAVDSGCSPLGGIQPFAGFCVNNVQLWQDLVAPAETWQAYAEFNYDFGNTELHVEGYYSRLETRVHYPPSFNQPKPITETVLPAQINPASFLAGTSPRLFGNWFVPLTNPGLAAYAAANPAQFPANTSGVFIPIGQWRPYLVGGNPFFGDASTPGYQGREQNEFRISAGLTGKLGDGAIGWNFDVTYGRNKHYLYGWDSSGVMIELALRGLGGPNCQWQTAAPGSAGCLWLNPMSNAIQSAPINGVQSNPGYNPAVANTKELADWLMLKQERFLTSQSAETNFGFDGELPGIDLGGGAVKWAVGGQWRWLGFRERDSKYADRTQVPCLNSTLNIPNANICTPTPYSPLGLAAAFAPTDIKTNVFAIFGEAVVPLGQDSDLTFGARYEDYGKDGGGSFNPQARAKFQLTDWLALRGSISSTFRAPPQTSLAPNPSASIPNILGRATALDLVGNPGLDPERATTWGGGVMVRTGGFDAAVDYYHYAVSDILTTEPQNAVVNALFPNGAAGADNCGTLDAAFIASHFQFTGPCSAANLSKVLLLRINGPKASFSGLDFRGTFTQPGIFGGTLQVGGVANLVLTYKFDPFQVAGLTVAGFDAVGKLNAGTLAHTVPKFKLNTFVNYQNGPFNVRWSGRYYSSYIDQRQAATAVGYRINRQFLHDVAINVDLPWEIGFTFAVTNLLDADPPLARLPEGYDAMTSDPLGRTFRIGLRKKF